jgi:hypothetical protein
MPTTSIPTLPALSFGVASVEPNQSIELSSLRAADVLSGDWTLSLKLRLRSRSQGGQLLVLQQNKVALRITGTTIEVVFQSSAVVSARYSLELGVWYSVCVTLGRPDKGDDAQVMIFIDGGPVSSPDPIANPMQPATVKYKYSNDNEHPVLGGGVDAEFMELSFSRGVLDRTDIIQNAYERPPAASLIAAFDFSNLKRDGSFTLVGGAALAALSPCTSFANGVVLPAAADGLNPGTDTSAPFSIQAWVRASRPVLPGAARERMVIVANGSANDARAFAFGVQYGDDLASFVMSVKFPGREEAILDTTRLASNVWINLSLTWDGNELVFYVNGQRSSTHAVNSSGAALETPAVALGAMAVGSSGNVFGGFFLGRLQGVGIWDRVLTPSELASFETPSPDLREGAVALLDLSGDLLVNNVGGRPCSRLGLVGADETFDLDAVSVPARDALVPGDPDAADVINLRKVQAINANIDDGSLAGQPLTSTSLSAAHVAGFEAGLAFYLGQVPDELRPTIDGLFQRNLRVALAQLDAATGPIPGAVTTTLEGNERVFWLHTVSGPVEVLRRDASATTSCSDWELSVVCGMVSLFLAVLGIKFSAGTVFKILDKIMLKKSAVLRRVIDRIRAWVLNPNGELREIITITLDLIEVLMLGGDLYTILEESLSDVDWWELTYTVLSILATIGSIFATGGAALALIIADLLLNVAGLVYTINQGRQNGCI